jgi:hypothetical protein
MCFAYNVEKLWKTDQRSRELHTHTHTHTHTSIPSFCPRWQEHAQDNRNLLQQSFYCLLIRREDPKPGKWRCLYSPQHDVSAPDVVWQLLICCLPITPLLHPRWAVTSCEFTLAPAYKACLLVRHSGGQRHLRMAIARGSALHRTNLGLKGL